MTSDRKHLDEVLDRHLGLYKASSRQNRMPVEHALDRFRNESNRASEASETTVLYARPPRRYGRWLVVIAAATAMIALAQQFVMRQPAPALPVPVQTTVPGPQRPPEPPKPPEIVTPPPIRFAVSSVKTMPPLTYMASAGLACHGVDGVERVVLTVTDDGMNTVKAPQGRCVGSGVFLSTLIELAYGIQSHNIRGGPDWARTAGFLTVDVIPETSKIGAISTLPTRGNSQGFAWIANESFQIDAVADNPSTATLGQLRQMLQTMLADRFGLKSHREQRQAPGYALVVAEGGPKLKPILGEYEESTLPTKGRATLDKLARTLSSMLLENLTVVDKTGLKGPYEYELHVMPADDLVERSVFLSRKLENQLGLRLQAEKSVSVEILVIDSVNPPVPN